MKEEAAAVGAGLDVCPCPRCGSWRSSLSLQSPDRQFVSPAVFCVSLCQGCGLRFQNPRIPLGELPKHYPDSYSPYQTYDWSLSGPPVWHLKHRLGYRHLASDLQPSARQKRYARWSCNYHLIPDFVPNGKLVEIGCAAGNRLALFRSLGWDKCVGYEYSDAAASKARARGFEVITSPVESAIQTVEDRSLDAIVAGFVLEHTINPFQLTREFASKLKPGGQLLFSTINIDSPDFWLYRQHWFDLDLPRHMVFFRRQDLRFMLKADFRLESTLTESVLKDYLGSARYRFDDARVGGWRRTVDAALLRCGPRLYPLFYYLARCGLGGRIYVSARKL